MLCNKCNQSLPDDSEFCQYCGEKLELPIDDKESTENAISIAINAESDKEYTEEYTNEETPCMQQEPLNEEAPSIQIPATSDKKKRFCKMCGGFVDLETKKCTSCGKQYFKMPKLSKRMILPIVICSVLIGIIIVLSILLVDSGSTISVQRKVISSKKAEITLLEKEVDKYKKRASQSEDKAKFMDDYIVLIGKKNNKYHKYGCSDFDGSFHAYNISAAKAKGYLACSKCN